MSQSGKFEGGCVFGVATAGDYEQCSWVNTVAGSWLLGGCLGGWWEWGKTLERVLRLQDFQYSYDLESICPSIICQSIHNHAVVICKLLG